MTVGIPNDPHERHLFDKMPGDWWDRAACRGHDSELWFPSIGTDVQAANAEAKAICQGCPVRWDCLDFALTPPVEQHGMWGGWTSIERRGMKPGDRAPKPKTNRKRKDQQR